MGYFIRFFVKFVVETLVDAHKIYESVRRVTLLLIRRAKTFLLSDRNKGWWEKCT